MACDRSPIIFQKVAVFQLRIASFFEETIAHGSSAAPPLRVWCFQNYSLVLFHIVGLSDLLQLQKQLVQMIFLLVIKVLQKVQMLQRQLRGVCIQ